MQKTAEAHPCIGQSTAGSPVPGTLLGGGTGVHFDTSLLIHKCDGGNVGSQIKGMNYSD
jgi:hypothetical protein